MPHDALVLTGAAAPPRGGGIECVRLTLPATNDGIREFLLNLSVLLAPLDLDEDALGNVEIILAELMNNVVEHAYAGRTDGQINIGIDLLGKLLIADVTDRGKAMPEHQVPRKRAAELDVPREDLPEGGFGWYMIHELVESLSYKRTDDMNIVRFSMRTA